MTRDICPVSVDVYREMEGEGKRNGFKQKRRDSRIWVDGTVCVNEHESIKQEIKDKSGRHRNKEMRREKGIISRTKKAGHKLLSKWPNPSPRGIAHKSGR